MKRLLALACFALLCGSAVAAVPVIYCSDLFHPHDDPDDHFDLAAIYALQGYGIEVAGIVLDQGRKQEAQPGQVPVRQMNAMTGRAIPAVIGLALPLANPRDTGEAQPQDYQGGVSMILEILQTSEQKVRIITVGSARDVVAAFNRRPELFREKVDTILSFIGESSNPEYQEYNVSLDPHAFVGLMRSGLPVRWVPCFDGGLWNNHGRASFWLAGHDKLLGKVNPRLQQFFLFCLDKPDVDPMEFLERSPDTEALPRMLAGKRNLWCTAIFGVVLDLVPCKTPTGYVLSSSEAPGAECKPLFEFSPLTIRLGPDGRISETGEPITLQTFRILDREHYAQGMTSVTAQLLQSSCFGPLP